MYRGKTWKENLITLCLTGDTNKIVPCLKMSEALNERCCYTHHFTKESSCKKTIRPQLCWSIKEFISHQQLFLLFHSLVCPSKQYPKTGSIVTVFIILLSTNTCFLMGIPLSRTGRGFNSLLTIMSIDIKGVIRMLGLLLKSNFLIMWNELCLFGSAGIIFNQPASLINPFLDNPQIPLQI